MLRAIDIVCPYCDRRIWRSGKLLIAVPDTVIAAGAVYR
jgi:hypothetical protein